MTYQEIFDTACAAVLKQGRKSRAAYPTGGGGCAYRGEDGTKCALGHLIPDDFYDPAFEGLAPMTVVIDPPEYDLKNVLCEVTGLAMDADDVCFLKELQRAHDLANSAYFCADFRRLARKVALKYNLDASVLQEDYDG